MRKSNLLMGILSMALVFGMMFTACEFSASASIGGGGGTDEPTTGPLAEGVYVGIISFDEDAREITSSDALTSGPILLDAAGRTSLRSTIDSHYKKAASAGTVLYYAVHTALHSMKALESRLPANAQSFNIITFTDGIDVGSNNPLLWDTRPLDGQNFADKPAEYLIWLNG